LAGTPPRGGAGIVLGDETRKHEINGARHPVSTGAGGDQIGGSVKIVVSLNFKGFKKGGPGEETP